MVESVERGMMTRRMYEALQMMIQSHLGVLALVLGRTTISYKSL
jgi:hypothetical protein